MILAIDIGNSVIKFGIYEPDGLLHRFSVATWQDYTPEELFFDRFRYVEQKFVRIDKVIVSSVVPTLNDTLILASKELFKVTPLFIDSSYDLGLKILCEPATSVGSDRLVGAFAAAEKHGVPVVICSLGTATVIDAVNSDREFLGGVIVPGVSVMAGSLRANTSLLPKVKIRKPEKLIGNNTEEAILSGVFHGTVALVEGIAGRMSAEIADRDAPVIILTGGFGMLLSEDLPDTFKFEENLVLDGLKLIAERA